MTTGRILVQEKIADALVDRLATVAAHLPSVIPRRARSLSVRSSARSR